jgi:hypothetical protein
MPGAPRQPAHTPCKRPGPQGAGWRSSFSAVTAGRASGRSPPRAATWFSLPFPIGLLFCAGPVQGPGGRCTARRARQFRGPAAVMPGARAAGGGLGRGGRQRREPGELRAAARKAGETGRRTGERGAARDGVAPAAGRRTPRSARRIPRAATAGQRISRPRTRCPIHGWPGRPCRSNPQEPSEALPGQ